MATPDWLPAFVEKYVARDRALYPRDVAWLEEQNGMVLYGTIGHHAVLRADGSVWYYEAVDWENSDEYEWRLAIGKEHWAAIVLGTKRFPELLELLPDRPSGTPDCQRCSGTGEILGGIICPDCGALGWDPDARR